MNRRKYNIKAENNGWFKKGVATWNAGTKGIMKSNRTSFKKGERPSPKTEFKKGLVPWNKGKEYLQIKGNKHPNWKGGISSLRNKVYHHFKYRQWRSDVFTRDDFTCQECGLRGVYLEADHFPKPFFKIRDEYNIKTIDDALLCDKLWNINNGRTLCKQCHLKTLKYVQK